MVVIFVGIGGAYKLGEDFKVIMGASQKETIFIGGVDPSRYQVKFQLDIWRRARLGEMVKQWGRESFYFSCNILHYILFGENFIIYVEEPLHSACLNLDHEETNNNQKREKIVAFVKTLIITTTRLILVTFSAVQENCKGILN